MRLEKRMLMRPRVELDIFFGLDELRFGLELKYLRAGADATVGDEHFNLMVGASDIERYDTIKDVARLERLVADGLIDAGAVIVLSNDPAIWSPSSSGRETGFDAFRLHDGSTLAGVLDWGPAAGAGTRMGREMPLELTSEYKPRWAPYSRVPAARNGELRSLTLMVSPAQAEV